MTGSALRWFFGHGSVMFSPRFDHVERRVGVLSGWERRYGQPSVRNWGTHEAPAPTSSLSPGGSVTGVLFGVDERSFEDVLAGMMMREAQEPIAVSVRSRYGHVQALTWPMSNAWEDLTPEGLAAAAVVNVLAGGGPSGDAEAYLAGVTDELSSIGGLDPLTAAYATALRTRRRSSSYPEEP